ncbi:BlaI/MecI/CopY family transcriptional regulator [Chryseobacterium koreense]|uniref:Transcriptional regulator n=1 Tax=Chryseobacterium koreense CCUG 49689 TaxID=1304281 RepID=A0A0J7J3K1_9FLAO|nr:BlaI/MecI/CopY family transcriptional regulator [Chryseobacterium koreense]KMQ72594.1 transcriptional regulator [Chryseobacterium koreense CCUG 49689]MBB5332981.1 putative transcriptional regulator [Chryseobacterium koreense]
MKINHLTSSEEQLMNIFWKLNSAYMREIVEHYPEPKPHQNTISTFLKILVEKEFLTTEKEGRIFKYTVAVPFEDYKKFLLRNFLDHYFSGSGSELVKLMLDEKYLKTSDFNQYFEIKTTVVPVDEFSESPKNDPISKFVDEITSDKKIKKKGKKKDKKQGKRSK